MKINSNFALKYTNKPQQILQSKQVAKPCVSQQNPISGYVKPCYLASKFNINFASNDIEKFNFEKSSKVLEENIAKKLNPEDYGIDDMKSALKITDDVTLIGISLAPDNINNFSYTGVSLNRVLAYMKSKNQLRLEQLPPRESSKEAFFVDELAVSYLENLQNRDKSSVARLVETFEKDKIRFYSFNVDKSTLEDLKHRLENIFQSEIEIKEINSHPRSEYKYPHTDSIMHILRTMAKEKNLSPEQEEKFYETALKYLDKTLCCYSYQSLAKKCTEAYKKIEQYASLRGKTMDDVYYYIPNPNKSYEVINYLYAVENGIDVNKFIFNRSIGGSRDREKIYVILDDCSLSGGSMMNAINVFDNSAFNRSAGIDLVFCPILTTQKGKEKAKEVAATRCLTYIPVDECKTYNKTESIEQLLKDGFTTEEIDILFKKINTGYADEFASIVFPYMIPDNSSEIVAKLGSHFLADNNNSANKAALFQIGKKSESECFN